MKKINKIIVFLILHTVANIFGQSSDLSEVPNPFIAYNFGLMDRETPDQVNLLTKIGFDGITFRVTEENGLEVLDEYISTIENSSNKFKIYSVFTVIKYDEC